MTLRAPASLSRRDLSLIASTRARLADGSARRARIASGVKVTEVASALDVTPQAVSQWESGRRTPNAANALGYAKALAAASGTTTH